MLSITYLIPKYNRFDTFASSGVTSSIMAVNWDLNACCGTEEIVFLVLFGVYFVINLLLWKTFILKPMKLMAVFVHEVSLSSFSLCGKSLM